MMLGPMIFVALVASATPLLAGQQPAAPTQTRPTQPAPPAGQGTGDAADLAVIPEAQLANMLDTYAIVQAQDALSIPDDRYGAFAARLKRVQDVRRRNQRARRLIVQELRQVAGPRAAVPVDEAAIRRLLTALREQDDRMAIEMRQAYDALDELLDARQQARFRIFEEVIEQRKLDLLVRARERARANRPGTR